jgi:Cu(I)/Ag(I) efflux system membrane fusion protein
MKENIMKKKILIIIAALLAGYWLGAMRSSPDQKAPAEATDAVTEYTCSMHPQIRQPGPGLCPICAMDLIPVGSGGVDPGPRAINLSPAARELAKIETLPVKRGPANAVLNLSGVLTYDASRQRDVAMLAEGQLRVLHANVAGMRVAAGDPLAEIYSPDVFAAARELVASGNNPAIANAARNKLRLYGLDETEIEAIAAGNGAPDTFTLRSPISGAVVEVEGVQGRWLMKGERLVGIADTSVLWAQLDVYGRDLAGIRVSQTAEIMIDAFAGEIWTAPISFIPAEVNEMTRSVKIRADLPDAEGRLKAGMLLRARLEVPVSTDAITVPGTAVLQTGKRAMVYVESPDEEGTFEARVVTLGARAGDAQIILSGLTAGERVVTRGAMRIDSSMQLLAKPSMMSLPTETDTPVMRPQTHCPIMGGRIDRESFIDYGGYRIYFCCDGCDADFLENPEQYIEQMRALGVEPERTPAGGGGHEHH